MSTIGDVPWPNKEKLEATLELHKQLGVAGVGADQLNELLEVARWALRTLAPGNDFEKLVTQNPLTRVFFRAGFLAAREMIANRPEGQDVRTVWPKHFGVDPGRPRLFEFDEVAEEIEKPDGGTGYRSKPIDANVEALPRAFQFLFFTSEQEKSVG